MKRRFLIVAAGSLATVILFSNCANQNRNFSSNHTANSAENIAQTSQPKQIIKVGVWAVIAEDILQYVKDNLAAKEGLDIRIVKFNDWIQPNTALRDGEIDANYFQHTPFMKNAAKQLNLNLVMLNPGFLTPLGIYSKRFKSLSEIPQKATIAIYKDRSNGDRCLRLLADQGLIKLKDNPENSLLTVEDIVANPKNLQFQELDGPAIVRSLDDVDLAVFSAGLRLQANLQLQPLAQETITQKRYAVGLVTLQEKQNDPKIQKLNKLLSLTTKSKTLLIKNIKVLL